MATRLTCSLEEAANAIIKADGHITNAANLLGLRPHTLKSMIERHAELQAVAEEVRILMVDNAQETISKYVNPNNEDGILENLPLFQHATWVLEHLASSKYRKSSEVVTAPKQLKELSFEELEQLEKQAFSRLEEKVRTYLEEKNGKQQAAIPLFPTEK